jgi:hypothetical protein
MAKLSLVSLFALSLIASFLACGGGSLTEHRLLSVTVAPTTANAADFSNGMVQFTATGTFDHAPSPATLNPATWDLAPSSLYPADAVAISASGIAQCRTGFSGTVTVRGGAIVCPQNPMVKAPCVLVFGTAQLTCP